MGSSEDSTSIWASRPRARARRRFAVLFGSGEGVPRLVVLREREVVLGRSDDVDVRLDARGVSRRHAKIVLSAGDTATLVDLDSKNGTFVNGTRVDVSPLREGDDIGVGPVAVLQFARRDEDDLLDLRPLSDADLSVLTPRQREVATLVAEGLSNPEVAERLHLKLRTVTSHLEEVFARLGVRSRTELARFMASGRGHGRDGR